MKNEELKIKNSSEGCRLSPKSGFSLLETIVAISILMITIVGPLSLASKGIVFADYVKDEITGFYLAQEALEAIRNIRDTNIKNDRYWLTNIAENCLQPWICRLDIWKLDKPDKVFYKCSSSSDECNDDTRRKNWERLQVVTTGSSVDSSKLYGYEFTSNIAPGRSKEPSIFSRRIIITRADYSKVLPDKLDSPAPRLSDEINEINVKVEVSWVRHSLDRSYPERKVYVSENMFSI